MIILDLSVEETENFRKQLDKRLISTMGGWHPYWYPLYPVFKNVHIIALKSDFVARPENINKIRNIFINHNISYAIQIREFENARTIDGFTDKEYFLEEDESSAILPFMSECFWYDNDAGWTMYVSHEGTVTFEGEWLVNCIKKQLDDYLDFEIKNFI